jgi:hypothetical protein
MDLAPVRCPPADQRIVSEFQRTTTAPAGDVTKRGSQEWLDKMEEAERRKNRAGKQLLNEYEQCRTGAGSAGSVTTRSLTTS